MNAGLHVHTGSRWVSARISQVAFGPNFLEVVGLAESGSLQRWYWTPGDGFLAGGTIASTAGGMPARIVACADRLTTMRLADAGIEVLTSDTERYPALHWRSRRVPVDGAATSLDLVVAAPTVSLQPAAAQFPHSSGLVVLDGRAHLLEPVDAMGWQLGPALPGEWRTAQIHFVDRSAAVLTGLDIDGNPLIGAVDLVHAGSTHSWSDTSLAVPFTALAGPADDIAACLSTLPANLAAPQPARTVEVVLRTGTELRHLRFDADTLRPHRTSEHVVRARMWN